METVKSRVCFLTDVYGIQHADALELARKWHREDQAAARSHQADHNVGYVARRLPKRRARKPLTGQRDLF